MEERIMENTIYGLFQETVNKNRSNVAIYDRGQLSGSYEVSRDCWLY